MDILWNGYFVKKKIKVERVLQTILAATVPWNWDSRMTENTNLLGQPKNFEYFQLHLKSLNIEGAKCDMFI